MTVFFCVVLLAQLCVRGCLEQHVFMCPLTEPVGRHDVLRVQRQRGKLDFVDLKSHFCTTIFFYD